MTQPQQPSPADVPPVVKLRAVAYHRNLVRDEKGDSIPAQQERIREWADKHDVEIIREYADGPSPPDDSQDE